MPHSIWRTFCHQLQTLHHGNVFVPPANNSSMYRNTSPVHLPSAPILSLAHWHGTLCQTTRERSPSTRTPSDGIWRHFCSRCTDAHSKLEFFLYDCVLHLHRRNKQIKPAPTRHPGKYGLRWRYWDIGLASGDGYLTERVVKVQSCDNAPGSQSSAVRPMDVCRLLLIHKLYWWCFNNLLLSWCHIYIYNTHTSSQLSTPWPSRLASRATFCKRWWLRGQFPTNSVVLPPQVSKKCFSN